ncbi:hypothetical protein EV363DRAFT_600693 [Boletus edulis]|nr:hypothetical protein EV363DRAFT_600693 [Boletus edulis]
MSVSWRVYAHFNCRCISAKWPKSPIGVVRCCSPQRASIHYQSRQGFNAAHRFVPFGFFQVRSWCPGLFRCSFLDHLEGANRNFRGQVTLANARQQSTEACTSFSPLDTVCRCLALLIRSICAPPRASPGAEEVHRVVTNNYPQSTCGTPSGLVALVVDHQVGPRCEARVEIRMWVVVSWWKRLVFFVVCRMLARLYIVVGALSDS